MTPAPSHARRALAAALALALLAGAAMILVAFLGTDPEPPPRQAAPPPAEPEPAPAPRYRSGLVVGLNAGGLDHLASAEAAARLGARHARVEFPIGTPAEQMRPVVAAYADRGIAVLALAGFHERLPTVDEARNLAGWAREFGPGGTFWASREDGHLAFAAIEFGNETSYSYQGTQGRGAEYAERLRDAHEAIAGPEGNARVGLLAQADDGGTRSDEWVDDMFDAVPDLGDRVTGWTVHPYGPDWAERIERALEQTAERGARDDLPLHVTEWGFAADDGRCLSGNYGWDPCMSHAEAAGTLRDAVQGMREDVGSRLRSLYLYQVTDQRPPAATSDREHYFGAVRLDGSPKGEYTEAVSELLAGSGGPLPPGGSGGPLAPGAEPAT